MPEKHIADLRAAFESFKFIPLPFVVSVNNANPKLVLYDNLIEYRGGFTTTELYYSEIEKINVYFWRSKTNNLVVYKKKGITTFIGNFRDREQLIFFLRVFKSKGCKLTDKAEMFLLS